MGDFVYVNPQIYTDSSENKILIKCWNEKDFKE